MSAFRLFAQINPNAIGALCCAGAVVLPISLLFYAAVLRTACHLCRMPIPRFGKAMEVVAVTGFLNLLISVGVTAIVYFVAGQPELIQQLPTNPEASHLQLLGSLIALPIGILVSGKIFAGLLKVSYGKGLLIYVVYLVVGVGAVLLLLGVVMGSLFIQAHL